jgi:uncharacterized protein (TIGR02271 family)
MHWRWKVLDAVERSREVNRVASEPEKPDGNGEVVIPLYAEELSFAKEQIAAGRWRISIVTRHCEEQVEVPLIQEHVEIERKLVGRPVESMPAIRQEGDTIVIPVVEEELVIERRLILKEEVRVTLMRKTETRRECVVMRKQELEIARDPAQDTQEP